MPNALSRPSLTITLADRYATQPIGGAFNARNIITVGPDKLITSQQEAEFCNQNAFIAGEQVGVSQFKNDGEGLSVYEEGLNTTPYDSTHPS
jgi:hypothetical protein